MMKKNLKKAVSLALASVMAFSLTACSIVAPPHGSAGRRQGSREQHRGRDHQVLLVGR